MTRKPVKGTTTPDVEVDTTSQQTPSNPGSSAKLPHERDQSIGATRKDPHPEVQQAFKDVKRGLENTDARGTDGRPRGSKKPAQG